MITFTNKTLRFRLWLENRVPYLSNHLRPVSVPASLYLENVFQTFSTSPIHGVVLRTPGAGCALHAIVCDLRGKKI